MTDDKSSEPDTLEVPFVFVKHGDPEPTEWMAAHPGWVKFPATMVPRAPAPATGTSASAQAYPGGSAPDAASAPNWMGTPVSAGAPLSLDRPGHRRGRPREFPGGLGAPGGGANEDPAAAYLRIGEVIAQAPAVWRAFTALLNRRPGRPIFALKLVFQRRSRKSSTPAHTYRTPAEPSSLPKRQPGTLMLRNIPIGLGTPVESRLDQGMTCVIGRRSESRQI